MYVFSIQPKVESDGQSPFCCCYSFYCFDTGLLCCCCRCCHTCFERQYSRLNIQSRNFPPPPSLVENFIRIYPSVWATALPHTHTHTHNHRDAHTYIHTPSVPSQHIQSKWLNIKTCLQTITSWLPIKYLFFLIYQMCRIVLLLFSAWYLDKNS